MAVRLDSAMQMPMVSVRHVTNGQTLRKAENECGSMASTTDTSLLLHAQCMVVHQYAVSRMEMLGAQCDQIL